MSTAELVNHRPGRGYLLSAVAIVASIVVFVVPFAFIVLTAVKDRQQSADLSFSWPHQFQFVQNFVDVVKARDYMLVIAFINSTILTVASVTGWWCSRRWPGSCCSGARAGGTASSTSSCCPG